MSVERIEINHVFYVIMKVVFDSSGSDGCDGSLSLLSDDCRGDDF